MKVFPLQSRLCSIGSALRPLWPAVGIMPQEEHAARSCHEIQEPQCHSSNEHGLHYCLLIINKHATVTPQQSCTLWSVLLGCYPGQAGKEMKSGWFNHSRCMSLQWKGERKNIAWWQWVAQAAFSGTTEWFYFNEIFIFLMTHSNYCQGKKKAVLTSVTSLLWKAQLRWMAAPDRKLSATLPMSLTNINPI